MDINKRLGKEEPLPILEDINVKNKLRVNDDDNVELLRLIPIVYEVIDNVMDRKYPYEELTLDGQYSGLQVILDYKELKRRIYKIGFKKKILILTELLPELLKSLMSKDKDYFILNGLRCTKVNDELYIGSDYSKNTIMLSYIEETIYAVLLDRVGEPFIFEEGYIEEDLSVENIADVIVSEDEKRKKDIFNRLINTTSEMLTKSEDVVTDVNIENEDKTEGVDNTGPKLTSENISLANLSIEEQKRLEEEVLASLKDL